MLKKIEKLLNKINKKYLLVIIIIGSIFAFVIKNSFAFFDVEANENFNEVERETGYT